MDHDEINNLFYKMLTDVKALIGEAVKENPDGIGMGTALGGTSVALVECAYQMGMDKDVLKNRLMNDIDVIYASGGSIAPQQKLRGH
jgi:hypothetical protein